MDTLTVTMATIGTMVTLGCVLFLIYSFVMSVPNAFISKKSLFNKIERLERNENRLRDMLKHDRDEISDISDTVELMASQMNTLTLDFAKFLVDDEEVENDE